MGVAEGFFYVRAGKEEILDDSTTGNVDVAGRADCFQPGVSVCSVYIHVVLMKLKRGGGFKSPVSRERLGEYGHV